MSEFPDNGRKVGSIDSLLKKIRNTDTIVRQTGSGRPCIRRVAVEDLVLSQDDKPKAPISPWDLAWNCHSPFKCAQENYSPRSPAQMLHTMIVLSCCWRRENKNTCRWSIILVLSSPKKLCKRTLPVQLIVKTWSHVFGTQCSTMQPVR